MEDRYFDHYLNSGSHYSGTHYGSYDWRREDNGEHTNSLGYGRSYTYRNDSALIDLLIGHIRELENRITELEKNN